MLTSQFVKCFWRKVEWEEVYRGGDVGKHATVRSKDFDERRLVDNCWETSLVWRARKMYIGVLVQCVLIFGGTDYR